MAAPPDNLLRLLARLREVSPDVWNNRNLIKDLWTSATSIQVSILGADDTIAGFAVFDPPRPGQELLLLWVDPKYRRAGMGRSILDRACARLKPPVVFQAVTPEGARLVESAGAVRIKDQRLTHRLGPARDAEYEQFFDEAASALDDATGIPSAGAGFQASVSAQIERMQAWAMKHKRVTARMWTALHNMQDGINRWLINDYDDDDDWYE